MLITNDEPGRMLPGLALLLHRVGVRPPDVGALLDAAPHDVVVLDAREDLAGAAALCRLLHATSKGVPVVVVLGAAGWLAVDTSWGVDDVVRADAGPAEIDARLRLARSRTAAHGSASVIVLGELVIDIDNSPRGCIPVRWI